ncbi:hypothetical protein ACQFN5_12135 [Klebsiella sp. WOUb02]|uniref:hypothetical protein n=1 Tax=Klebsiella sp. WOUb02 TaxID=3161071 RepID=UPI003CFA30B6
MYQYHDLVEKVIAENRTTLLKVDEREIEQLIEEIRQAKTIQSLCDGQDATIRPWICYAAETHGI